MATESGANEELSDLAERVLGKLGTVSAPLTQITVAGYKSIRDERSIELRPLTILAGANSSGKSSIMQPLLLMKQTLEAPFDPGALRLDGPNVRFTNAEQLLSRTRDRKGGNVFHVGLGMGRDTKIVTCFKNLPRSGFDAYQTTVVHNRTKCIMNLGMSSRQFQAQFSGKIVKKFKQLQEMLQSKFHWEVICERCFLRPLIRLSGPKDSTEHDVNREMAERIAISLVQDLLPPAFVAGLAQESLQNLIHLAGLRGNPERNYPVTGVGDAFPGLFQSYVASIIAEWDGDQNEEALSGLSHDLQLLGLSWKITAKRVSDAQVEIRVGRLPSSTRRSPADLVSIADVGFGVSQALPVIVALRVATPDNLVYIEQPEIHLHPRAQVAMARLLADAVKRGVRIVAETHSPLLLLAIQTLVAQGDLSPDLVRLHWFMRSKTTGVTKIRSADLDDAGAFGDWPEDFGSVEAEIENRYLSAAEAKLLKK